MLLNTYIGLPKIDLACWGLGVAELSSKPANITQCCTPVLLGCCASVVLYCCARLWYSIAVRLCHSIVVCVCGTPKQILGCSMRDCAHTPSSGCYNQAHGSKALMSYLRKLETLCCEAPPSVPVGKLLRPGHNVI